MNESARFLNYLLSSSRNTFSAVIGWLVISASDASARRWQWPARRIRRGSPFNPACKLTSPFDCGYPDGVPVSTVAGYAGKGQQASVADNVLDSNRRDILRQ